MSSATIDRLTEERQQQLDFVEQTLAKVDAENRDLVDAEKRNLESARDRVKQLDEQLTPLREFEELRNAHRASSGRPAPRGDGSPVTGLGAETKTRSYEYRTAGEFMADAWRAKTQGDEESRNRIASLGRGIGSRGDAELEVTDIAIAREADRSYVASLPAEQRASAPNVTTVEIPGVMPVSVIGPLLNDLDAARPFLSSMGVKDLSNIKGKTFTRPVVSQHVTVGTQSAEKTAVAAGQLKIDDVDFTKSTEGGYVDVSRQSIDWSSPEMWDALMTDFVEVYGLWTENKAADNFAALIAAGSTNGTDTDITGTPTLANYINSMYDAAVKVYTGSQRMPDHAWMSLDVWAAMGKLLDNASASAAGSGVGSSSVANFQAGGMLDLPRTVVPSFPAGTFIVGRANRYEAYEERLGFLSAVEPKLLGIELAYGGYFADNVLNVAAFSDITYS